MLIMEVRTVVYMKELTRVKQDFFHKLKKSINFNKTKKLICYSKIKYPK